MKFYHKDEISVLEYLLEYSFIRYERAIEWAYDQYKYGGVPGWIEKISLETSVAGMVEILRSEFGFERHREFSDQYISEVAKLFVDGAIKASELPLFLYDYMEIDSNYSNNCEPVYVRFYGHREGADNRTEVISDIDLYFQKLAKKALNDYSSYIRT